MINSFKTIPGILFLALFLFLKSNSFSQNFIKGIVRDSLNMPIAYCPIALMNAADSSQVKGNISDSVGFYIFEKVKSGNYFIKFQAVGYKPMSTVSFAFDSLSQITIPNVVLQVEGVNLKEVSIAANIPLIEFKKGMVVMNVENDVLAKGNTVLELLKRIPGVIVDAQNNITINGVGGARFMIDERLQQMPTPQVVDMLAGMSADAVKKIELIKNPPARYDAAGTGGLINIVTKKAKLKGYNGSIAFGASKGKVGRLGPFGSFNYKSNKLSIFTNFSYGHWDGENNSYLFRTLTRDGITESINSQGTTKSFQRVFSGSGGIEYDITPKTLLGLYINGNHNNDFYSGKTTTEISNSNSFDYDKLVYTTDHAFNISSPSYNLSLVQKIDTIGGQIKLTAGFDNTIEKQNKLNENHFYNTNNVEINPASKYNTAINQNFKIFTQKLDLNKTLKSKFNLESGLKSSFADIDNTTQLFFSNQSTGLFVGDTTIYNDYRYKERILSAYSTISRNWDKFGFSVGLRAEDTDINAKNPRTGFKFTRHYFSLFPSGSMDLTLNKKHSLTSAYSYRIDRPYYSMINPIPVFNEQLNYSVGNPQLKPQYTHNINVDHNFNNFITQSLGAGLTKDFTFYYSYTPDSSKVNIDTLFNFPHRNEYYYSISAQKRIKWYSFQTYGVIMYRSMKGEIRNQDVGSQSFNFYINLNQEFYLPKDFKLQIWAGYGNGVRDGLQYYFPRSAIHMSINKTFLDKKLSVTLSVNDILYKDYGSYSSTLKDQYFYYKDIYDTRRIRININYRFGKMQIDQRIRTENDSRVKTGK